jgi:MoxR-like ATPase
VATATAPQHQADARDLALLDKLAKARKDLAHQIGQRIVGQHDVVDGLVTAILAGGHVLMIGVPGLAKTLMIQTLAQALDMSYSRVQFTPDLMPSDITGTELLEDDGTGKKHFRFTKGPVFANIILADEINRAPPKTQAALLEAMQEHKVTASGKTYQLPEPFFVLATQNPIEHEGTYHLPEAQLDRFMFELTVGYPNKKEEEDIVAQTTSAYKAVIKPVLNADEIIEMQQLVRRMPAPPSVVELAVKIARSTRPHEPGATAEIKKYVSYGAGPRAGQNLVLGAKARAAMEGRSIPDLDDIKAMVRLVMKHRVVMNFQAEAEGVTVDQLIKL